MAMAAGVPIPLPRIAPRTGSREGIGDAGVVALAPRAVQHVAAQRLEVVAHRAGSSGNRSRPSGTESPSVSRRRGSVSRGRGGRCGCGPRVRPKRGRRRCPGAAGWSCCGDRGRGGSARDGYRWRCRADRGRRGERRSPGRHRVRRGRCRTGAELVSRRSSIPSAAPSSSVSRSVVEQPRKSSAASERAVAVVVAVAGIALDVQVGVELVRVVGPGAIVAGVGDAVAIHVRTRRWRRWGARSSWWSWSGSRAPCTAGPRPHPRPRRRRAPPQGRRRSRTGWTRVASAWTLACAGRPRVGCEYVIRVSKI